MTFHYSSLRKQNNCHGNFISKCLIDITVKEPVTDSEMRTKLGMVQLSVHYFNNLSSGEV